MDGSENVNELKNNEVLKRIDLSFSNKKENLKSDATSRLWLQYMEMMDYLKSNIRADRIGNILIS